MPRPLTNAVFARRIATIGRGVSSVSASLAEGMWNPDFCSADATDHALSVCEDIQRELDHIRKLIGEPI